MNQSYYNRVSDLDLQRGGYYPQKIKFFEKNLALLKKKFKRDLRILDVACNDGYLGKIYSNYGRVWGVDINELAVQRAKEAGIQAVCGDVFSLDTLFGDQKFDVVIAGDIIEHVFDTDLFLQKIRSVLDTQGSMLLSTPNLASLGRRLMLTLGKNPYCEYSSESDGVNVGHIRYYTFQDMRKQLDKNGFSDIILEADTTNIPIFPIDTLLVTVLPQLGREILVRAKKI